MADRYLLESGAPDGYLLEDGSGVLLLEVAPVAFDNSANITAGSAASLTFLHTCAGVNRVLIVDVAVGTSAGGDTKTVGVTYNSVSMTSMGKRHTADQTSGFVERFGLVAPATGLNTVAVTLNSAATSLIGASQSFTNADQDATLVNYTTVTNVSVAGAGSTAATVTAIAPPAGTMVMGGHGAGSSFSAVGNTSRYNVSNSSSTGCGNLTGNTAVGAGSNIAMTSTVSGADWWVSFATTIPQPVSVVTPSTDIEIVMAPMIAGGMYG